MYNWKDARNYRRFRDENGNVIETTVQRVGFRKISKADINEAGTRKCRCHLLNKTGKEA